MLPLVVQPLHLSCKAERTCGMLSDIPAVLARNKDDWYGRKLELGVPHKPFDIIMTNLKHALTNDLKLQIPALRTGLGGTFFF